MRVLLLAVLLAGCAHKEPAVEVRTVEVPVIRVTKCIDAADIPKRPGPLPKRPASISAAVDTLLAKVREWELFGERSAAVMKGCAG